MPTIPSIPGAQVPFLDVRTGLVSREWYNWLSTRSGRIDLSVAVTGTLMVENGGTGLNEGTPGGVLYFDDTDSIASSVLDANEIVLGGGAGALSTPVGLGTATAVLHGNASGAPTFGAVNLTTDVTGVLPVLNGGTGTTTNTGTGNVVLSNAPALVTPFLIDPEIIGEVYINGGLPVPLPRWFNNDAGEVSVTAAATDIVDSDTALFFVTHDKTSGGFAVGVMDATVGAITIVNTIAGVTFSYGSNALQAQVTAGADPRLLSTYSVSIGDTA